MEYLKNNTIKSRYFTIHHNNGICFNDNTARAALQRNTINIIRSKTNCTTTQMYRGCIIGNEIMTENEFNTHLKNADQYFENANTYLNSAELNDKIPKVVAHHCGQNKVCGRGKWANPHAEIQILEANKTTPCLEMGITKEMCNGQYDSSPNGCQTTITNEYEDNKVIFAKDPSALRIFPHGKLSPITERDVSIKCLCDICNVEIPKDHNVCRTCRMEDDLDQWPSIDFNTGSSSALVALPKDIQFEKEVMSKLTTHPVIKIIHTSHIAFIETKVNENRYGCINDFFSDLKLLLDKYMEFNELDKDMELNKKETNLANCFSILYAIVDKCKSNYVSGCNDSWLRKLQKQSDKLGILLTNKPQQHCQICNCEMSTYGSVCNDCLEYAD